ncbi:MAG: FeoB-associated Cys-rich membrane protein [Clostridiaceae bacterium]|nr:FeoB-associated Cys-rich membrane protein [Eubacteriales bacterium]
MFEWLSANWGSLLVGLAVAAIVAAVAIKMIRDKKNHKSGCACGCEGCPRAEICHKS